MRKKLISVLSVCVLMALIAIVTPDPVMAQFLANLKNYQITDSTLNGTTSVEDLNFTATDTEPGTTEGMIYWDDSENGLKQYTGSAWVALGSGTFTGGNITSDIVMANGEYIRSSTTTAQSTALQAYDTTGPGYTNALSITNGAIPDLVLGATTSTLEIASTGLNVSTAGAVTGVSTIVSSGAITAGTGLTATTTLAVGGTVTLESGETIANTTASEIIFAEGGAEDIILDMDAASNAVGLKSSTGVDELAMGAVDDLSGVGSILFDAAAASMTTATGGDAQDLTIGITGATNSSLIVASSGTAADALQISTSAGGMDITVAGAAAGEDLDLLSNASINLTATEADAAAITLDSTGGIDLTSSATYDIDVTATGGTVQVVASEAAANQFKVDAQGTVAGNAIVLETTNGGIEFNADNATNGDITATAEDDISITATDDLALNGGSAGSIITVGGNTHGNTINIGEDDTTADTITIGSAKDTSAVAGIAVTVGSTGGASATTIQSGTGDLALTSTDDITLDVNTATSDNITITNTPGTAADAIKVTATAGGIDMDAAAGKIIDIDGGTIQIDSATEGAGAIALTSNQGATDTITVTNTQGTGDAAITLAATAGGITLTSTTGTTTSDPIIGDGTAAWYGGLKAIVNDGEPHAVLAAESGKVLTNLGSDGADAWTLPTAAAGYEYTFVVMAAQEMRITVAAGDAILGSSIDVGAGDYYSADAIGETLHLIAVDGTNWIIISSTGTWTDSNP